jgi:threonine dehydratase
MTANTAPSGVSLLDILAAHRRIAGRIRRTPLVLSPALSEALGAPVHLKLEHRQRTGSFKLRGASNAILSLDERTKARGVVAVSTGNHGRALAQAAKEAGIRCVICLSRLVPQNKVDAIRDLGAELRIVGRSQDEAQREVDRLVAEEGMTAVPPFDDPAIIAGQGTIGLEILEELPRLAAVVVPLSGGGLISGIALAVKTLSPETRLIGASMSRGAAMQASLAAGRPVEVAELPTLADSLGGGIGLANRYTFAMVRALVDEVVLVEEREIAEAVRHAYWAEQEIVEGAAAVGIAALRSGRARAIGATAVVLSGRNIDMELHHRLVSGEAVDLAHDDLEGGGS